MTRVYPIQLARSIIADVSDRTGVTEDEILSDSRRTIITAARHEVYYRLRNEGLSLPTIAKLMGRHENTVAHGIAKRSKARIEGAR